MNKITILGSSASVPTIERGMPSVSLLYKGELMLFDCGEGTQRQMMKFKVHYGRIRYVFISHMHLDHYLGIFGYIETLELNNRSTPLELFVPPKSKKKIQSLMKFPKFVKITEYKKGEILKTKDFTVTAFPLDHNIEVYGFVFEAKDKKKFNKKKTDLLGIRGKMFRELEQKNVIKIGNKKIRFKDVGWIEKGFKMVYVSDTRPSKNTIKMSKNADYLIHDATFLENEKELAFETKHSTAKECAEIAKKANVKNLILYHISARYKKPKLLEKEAKKIFRNSILAKDGNSFKFS